MAIWAGLLYRPWVRTPFPIYDFSGLLSTFRHEASFAGIVGSLNAQYAADGRLFPLQIVVLALQWELFRDNVVGWHLARFATLLAVVALAAVLLRRFGATFAATVLAVGLFVVANGAVQSWYFLAMSEPVGVLLVLGASLLATRQWNSRRPIISAILIGVMLCGAIAAKETFLAAVPFVLLVMALQFPITRPFSVRVNRRWFGAVLVVGSVIALVSLLPLALVLAQSQSGSYGSRYSVTGMSTGQLLNAFYATTLPVTRAPHFPANVAYVCVILAGFSAMWRERDSRRHWVSVIAGGSLLLLGVMIYAPWPGYPGYYALAFLPGSCLVLAASVSAIEETTSRRGRLIAFCGTAGVLAIGSALAAEGNARYRAGRMVDYAVAVKVGETRSARTLVVGVPNPASSGEFGRGILLYARYLGSPLNAEAIDVTCSEASQRARHADEQTIVVRTSELCPAEPEIPGGARIAYGVTTFDWRHMARRQVAVTGQVWGGSHAASAPPRSVPISLADSYRAQ